VLILACAALAAAHRAALTAAHRRQGTDGWTEEQLRAAVSRDAMVGVCHASADTSRL
jgi:hypothetical protein